MMNQIPEEDSKLETKSRDFDPSTLRSWETGTHSSPQAIAAVTQVRVQDPFPCKRTKQEPRGPYPWRGIMQLLPVLVLVQSTVSHVAT
jgi:hypothetical protein